jgi:hypothetical protein
VTVKSGCFEPPGNLKDLGWEVFEAMPLENPMTWKAFVLALPMLEGIITSNEP